MRYQFGGLYLEGLIHGGAYLRNFTVSAFFPELTRLGKVSFNFSLLLYSTVVSIYYGLDTPKVQLGKQGLWAVIAFYIGEFLIFMFELYLILSKRNKENNSVSIGNTRGKRSNFL